MNISKDLIFYSNYCDHSKSLINFLMKKNIIEDFTLICVDTKKYKIPDYIKCVPTLFTTKNNILIGDAIKQYLNKKNETENDVNPYSLIDNINSSQYTFLTEDKEDYDLNESIYNIESKNFGFLNTEQKIISQVDKDNNNSNKFDENAFDSYLTNRQRDYDAFKTIQEKQRKESI